MGVGLKEFLHLCDRLANAYERLLRASYTTSVSDGNAGAIADAIAIVDIRASTGRQQVDAADVTVYIRLRLVKVRFSRNCLTR